LDKKIYLDYDPKYQGIIKTAAHMMFACTAIFLVQVVLLISNTQLFGYAGIGDLDKFLRMIDTNAIPFIVINLNIIALRVLYAELPYQRQNGVYHDRLGGCFCRSRAIQRTPHFLAFYSFQEATPEILRLVDIAPDSPSDRPVRRPSYPGPGQRLLNGTFHTGDRNNDATVYACSK